MWRADRRAVVLGWLNLRINSERLRADFEALAEIGATVGGGVSRLALSQEDLAARSWFADRIEEAGLQVVDDEVGNLSGVLGSRNPDAKTLMIGSHLDTVPNGGRYDGSIGVLIALECLRRMKESGIRPKARLEAINFTDEEGTWQSLLGSKAVIGKLNADELNHSLQANGAFRAALYRAGIRADEVHRAHRDPTSILGYLEVHIEQSGSLHEQGHQLGIVDRIVGRIAYTVTFHGEAAHAGTTTAEERRDALQGAAAFIILAHKLVAEEYPEGVINCGHVSVDPDSFNVVPAQASLRVEFPASGYADPARDGGASAAIDAGLRRKLSPFLESAAGAVSRSRADVARICAPFRAGMPTRARQLYDDRQLFRA